VQPRSDEHRLGRSGVGWLVQEQVTRFKLANERIDIGAGAYSVDVKRFDKPLDQFVLRCARREGRPENPASRVDRQIPRLAQVEDDKLALHLAPIQIVFSQPQATLRHF
jgi:hypothetical protein